MRTFLTFTIRNYLHDVQEGRDKWKEEIRQKWINSSNLPRKTKKRVRKELLINWSIANWDPFNY